MTDKEKIDKLEIDVAQLNTRLEKLINNFATFLSPDTPDKSRMAYVVKALKEDGDHKKEEVVP